MKKIQRFSRLGSEPTQPEQRRRLKPIAISLGSLGIALAVSQQAGAVQFKTSDDWSVRWDNTVKYNLAFRTENPDTDVIAGSNGALADDADLNFGDRWSNISNRFDLLSEVDVVWRDKVGFRVSGAGWYDQAYKDNDWNGINDALGGLNTLGVTSVPAGEFTDAANQLHYAGGELLDAFVFYNFNAGSVSGNIRAGRHTIFWGNSLLLSGAVHGVAGSMVAIDVAKGFSVPGSEAQELFLPTNKLSTVIQVTPNLTVNAYYSLEWRSYRLPETGSFFSPAEVLTDDSEFLMVAPGVPGLSPRVGQAKVSDEDPDDRGEWGVNLQYYFNAPDLEASFFFLSYKDKLQQGITGAFDFGQFTVAQGSAGNPPFDELLAVWTGLAGAGVVPPPNLPNQVASDAVSVGQFKWAYKEDIRLYGFGLSKEIGGISSGLEVLRRENTALAPDLGASIERFDGIPPVFEPTLAPMGISNYDFQAADADNYPGAVGNTMHVVVNALGLLNSNAAWDAGSWIVEVTAAWLDQVTENEQFLDKNVSVGGVASTIGFVFAPEWFQIFAGTDLRVPLTVSHGIYGDSPISLGGNEGLGNASLGAEFLIKQKWTIAAKYNMFYGSAEGGLTGLLKDRDNIALTFKATF